MKFWFDGDDAQRYGLPAAAVLAHLKYWIERNTHAGEEPCMTQSIKEMGHYLPFLSFDQIRRGLEKLEKAEEIFRKANGFDRRHTYCLAESPHGRGNHATTMRQESHNDVAPLPQVHIETNTLKTTESTAYARPTEDEVVEYFRDIGAADLAAQLGLEFHTHYESTGWIVSGVPMAQWKPKARSWLARRRNQQSNDRRKGFNPSNFTPEGLKDFIDNG